MGGVELGNEAWVGYMKWPRAFCLGILGFLVTPHDARAEGACFSGEAIELLRSPMVTRKRPLEEQVQGTKAPASMAAHQDWRFVGEQVAAVGRLEISYASGDASCAQWCTGFLVSEKYILTAHHCIPKPLKRDRVLAAFIRFNFADDVKPEAGNRFKLKTVPQEGNPDLDYSLVEIENGAEAVRRYGTVKLSYTPALANEPLAILHHPLGSVIRLSRECAAAQSDGNFMPHSCATYEASSGAPIFSLNTKSVVGLHTETGKGVTLTAVALDSLRIRPLMPVPEGSRMTKPGGKNDPPAVPLALLKGASIYMGKKSWLDQPNDDESPFGKDVLRWMINGNPIDGERLKMTSGAVVRSFHPRTGGRYGKVLAILREGDVVRIKSYVRIFMKKDEFFFGRIDDVQ